MMDKTKTQGKTNPCEIRWNHNGHRLSTTQSRIRAETRPLPKLAFRALPKPVLDCFQPFILYSKWRGQRFSSPLFIHISSPLSYTSKQRGLHTFTNASKRRSCGLRTSLQKLHPPSSNVRPGETSLNFKKKRPETKQTKTTLHLDSTLDLPRLSGPPHPTDRFSALGR